jgi:hypothetical protein
MAPAPILLFTYKRLDVLKQTVDALKNNYLASDSDLFIFSDGAKCIQDESIVNEIRVYLRQVTGFKNISITESKTNKGLANSIINGVSEIIDQYESAIVLEDDLITTANFLLFMNAGLEAYRNKKGIFSISGYSFNLGIDPENKSDAYFLNRGWSWGWATWKDRWKKVDWEVKSYDKFVNDNNAKKEFAKGGSDLNKMLEKQMKGKLDSWAIRWFYHQFYMGGLTVYPVLSKVYNAGFDKDATHTKGSNNRYIPMMDATNKMEFRLPEIMKASSYYSRHFQNKMNVFSRVVSKIETYIKNLKSIW